MRSPKPRFFHPPRLNRRQWLWFTAVVGIVLIATLSVAGWAWSGAERTELAQWMMAVASIITLMAAVVAASFAAAAFRLESDREEHWAASQRSSQASLIAAWPGRTSHLHGELDESTGETEDLGINGVEVYLRNASHVPVTQVWIDATLVIGYEGARDIRKHHLGMNEVRILAPSDASTVFVATATPIPLSKFAIEGTTDVRHWVDVQLSFRDAGGRDWSRLPDGTLILVQD